MKDVFRAVARAIIIMIWCILALIGAVSIIFGISPF